MSQEELDNESTATPTQQARIVAYVGWGLLSLFVPPLGVPLTWINGKNLHRSDKWIISISSVLGFFLLWLTAALLPAPSKTSAEGSPPEAASQSQVAAQAPVVSSPEPKPSPSSSPIATIPSPQPQAEPKSKATSFSALVEQTDEDSSYEAIGRVQEKENTIIVVHHRTWECSAESSTETARQEWQTVFDLSSKTWTERDRELSACFGNPAQEWSDFLTDPSPFTIETSGKETVIRADLQNTDGSMIAKDYLVVRYTKP